MLVPLKDLVCLLPVLFCSVLFIDGSIFRGFVFHPNCITNKRDN